MPLNVLLKPREIAYHLRDADAKAYFCQEGTPELPMGEMGFTAFQEVESCQHFFLMTNDPTRPIPHRRCCRPWHAHAQSADHL